MFRSFPFRAPAAPVANGVDAQVEEAQAPPPNGTLAREPEEAGEIVPVQADPENVGEDASAQPPVRPSGGRGWGLGGGGGGWWGGGGGGGGIHLLLAFGL